MITISWPYTMIYEDLKSMFKHFNDVNVHLGIITFANNPSN